MKTDETWIPTERDLAWIDDAAGPVHAVLAAIEAAWLRVIAIHRCRNHFRGLGAWRRLLERFRGHVQSDSGRPGDDPREQSDWIRHALQRLSAADRTILVLHYLEELPLEELAETLNARAGTLAVRLHRARERLKRLLDRPMDPEVEL